MATQLPPEPAFARPVHVTHGVDDRLLLVAARERAGRAKANSVIVCFIAWYEQLRATYAAAGADGSPPTVLRCGPQEKRS